MSSHVHPKSESCRSDAPSMHDIYSVMSTKRTVFIQSRLYDNGVFVLKYVDRREGIHLIELIDGMEELMEKFCTQKKYSVETIVNELKTLFHKTNTPIEISFLYR